MAVVDWVRARAAFDAGTLPCSSGEAKLLAIAASLGEGIPVELRDALTGLDASNTELVRRMVSHAADHRRDPSWSTEILDFSSDNGSTGTNGPSVRPYARTLPSVS
jgi:hypothetical protein